MELEAQIKAFLTQNLLYLEASEYSNETSLIGEGLIDSIGIVELVTYIQTNLGVTFGIEEITTDNFDSVSRIAAFVRRKQAAAVAQSV